MPHATYPIVEQQSDGTFMARMIDKKRGRVWGVGYGDTRQDAIALARADQPGEHIIKRAIGWTVKHPFKAGGLALAYSFFRPIIRSFAREGCLMVSQFAHAFGLPKILVSTVRNAYKVLP